MDKDKDKKVRKNISVDLGTWEQAKDRLEDQGAKISSAIGVFLKAVTMGIINLEDLADQINQKKKKSK
jgi:hypothetical protein